MLLDRRTTASTAAGSKRRSTYRCQNPKLLVMLNVLLGAWKSILQAKPLSLDHPASHASLST